MSDAPESLEPFDATAVIVSGLALDFARGHSRQPFEHAQLLAAQLARHPMGPRTARDHVDGLRTFADGTRAEVVVTRRVERGTIASFVERTSTIDTSTGLEVIDPPPWRDTDAALARAIAGLALPAPAASLRAVSSDGHLLFFVLGRNPNESWDPDAGNLTTYDVTVGLWDDVARVWRWESTSSLAGLGVGTWLLEQASFDFTFDETGIIGRGSRDGSSEAYSVADGKPRPLAPTDRMSRPRSLGEGVLLAADRAATRALVARSTHVELWDLVSDHVVASLDLAPIDDVATAAAFVTPAGSFVIGTELGRLLRFTPSSR